MDKPLSGIKVLELSTFVAAPVCARLLADLGADVIKVERPEGDGWRVTGKSYIPARFSDQENPVFDIYNSGKKHIALNLKDPEGMGVFQKLLQEADVFVTNMRPAALKRLGLSYEELKETYPALIYAIVLGFGEKGPDASKPAFDTTAFWSKSGFLRDMAPAGEHYAPVIAPSSVGDTFTGTLLLAEIGMALYRRAQTGKGDYVSSTLYHNGIFAMGTMAIISQKPFGRVYPCTRVGHGVPGGYYETADGEWLLLGGITPISKSCQLIGRPELLEDPRFATDALRRENREELFAVFREQFLSKTCDEWLEIGERLDVAMEKLNHFSDVSEDEQAWANHFVEQVEFANGNVDVMPSSPIEMESVGALKTTPAACIGRDSAEILQRLGYTSQEIETLMNAGAVFAADIDK